MSTRGTTGRGSRGLRGRPAEPSLAALLAQLLPQLLALELALALAVGPARPAGGRASHVRSADEARLGAELGEQDRRLGAVAATDQVPDHGLPRGAEQQLAG